MHKMMKIEKYNADGNQANEVHYKSWKPEFLEVAEDLINFIQKIVNSCEIEHVGSTAIPECHGKGIIDLLLTTKSENIPTAIAQIEKIGFQLQSGGVIHSKESPMREGGVHYKGHFYKIHLHIADLNSARVIIFRKFRDALKNDKNLVKEYVEIKTAIINSGTTDRAEYTQKKNDFISSLLNRT